MTLGKWAETGKSPEVAFGPRPCVMRITSHVSKSGLEKFSTHCKTGRQTEVRMK